jgi:hypothetical protein
VHDGRARPGHGEIDSSSFDGTDPAPGSALTCFNVTGKYDTRVYYLDRQNQINELAWQGGKFVNAPL